MQISLRIGDFIVVLKYLRYLPKPDQTLTPSIVGIGSFDGVHRGHQAIIANVLEQATHAKLPTWILTFDPHPKEFFSHELALPRITTLREKIMVFKRYGIQQVACLKFNATLANLSPTEFVEKILVNYFNAKGVVIGEDFHFGKQRAGDVGLLESLGDQYQFNVIPVKTVTDGQQRYSSTLVRNALMAADLDRAKDLLARTYSICGRVIHGDERGRTLGFPTANIHLGKRILPVNGVFAVRVHGLGDHALPGVANAGKRPTVDGLKRTFEVHLLDFDQDIYGRYIEIEFVQHIRGEMKFDTLQLLQDQIARDVEEARAVLLLQQKVGDSH